MWHESIIANPVIEFVRNLLRPTPFAKAWRHRRQLHRLSSWTSHDDVMLSFYSQFAKADSLCFDIGANTGNRTKVFRRLGARVVAVEPEADCLAILQRAFSTDFDVCVVGKAVAHMPGSAILFTTDAPTLSSLSRDWIDSVRNSGRFGHRTWVSHQNVSVTTLDSLIAAHGRPDFIKVDVEGSELNVLRGLSKPVPALSFEFTPEAMRIALASVDYLTHLGDVEFNYSLGESMTMEHASWLRSDDVIRRLQDLQSRVDIYGDVYARFATTTTCCR